MKIDDVERLEGFGDRLWDFYNELAAFSENPLDGDEMRSFEAVVDRLAQAAKHERRKLYEGGEG